MQREPLDLSVVIVNYNTRQLLLECLESIYQKTHTVSMECIVVDNASVDGSVEAVRTNFPQVQLIANKEGRFFSGGNNQGIALAQGRYVIALNPDMIVLGDTLAQLVQQMDANPQIGAATTTMYYPDKQLQRNGSRRVTFGYLIFQYTLLGKLFPRQLKAYRDWLWYADWDRTTPREVGVMPGSCIIAPKSVWTAVQGFNEKLRIYFTEDYLSNAVQKLGKQTVYLVSDGIIHYEGASTQEQGKRVLRARYLNMYLRDLLIYTGLVFGRFAQAVLAVLLIPTWIGLRLKAR
jgi:GT2 family glycosyltransferase